MKIVIQNHNTNFLKVPVTPKANECSCRQKFNCSLAEKCLSEGLVYHVQVDRSGINQTKNYYDTCEKISKSGTTIIGLLLEIKVKKKYRTLKTYLGVEK